MHFVDGEGLLGASLSYPQTIHGPFPALNFLGLPPPSDGKPKSSRWLSRPCEGPLGHSHPRLRQAGIGFQGTSQEVAPSAGEIPPDGDDGRRHPR